MILGYTLDFILTLSFTYSIHRQMHSILKGRWCKFRHTSSEKKKKKKSHTATEKEQMKDTHTHTHTYTQVKSRNKRWSGAGTRGGGRLTFKVHIYFTFRHSNGPVKEEPGLNQTLINSHTHIHTR